MPIPKLLLTAGLMAANMALSMTRKIEGPRQDTAFTGGDYGAELPMVWGTRRLQCPIFWAEDLREVKRRRKTKGGKFNDYTYYGTWAVALAGHEISGVTRIWFDTHLVYDVTGAGPVTPFDFGEAGNISDFLTVYTGTETQEPDPRMMATVEAEFGEGSCPAYRGTAYVMFKDVPLEKIGNRIPQVSVEMFSAGAVAYPYETFDTTIAQPDRLWGATFSSDWSRFMWGSGGDYEIWDVAARSRMISGTLPAPVSSVQTSFGMYANGDFAAVGEPFPASGNQLIYLISADGTSASTLADLGAVGGVEDVRVIADGNGTEHWMTVPFSIYDVFHVDGTAWNMADIVGIGWAPTAFFADLAGNIWAVGRAQTIGTTTAYFYRVVTVEASGPSYVVVTGLAAMGATLRDCTACVAPNGQFVLAWDYGIGGHIYAVDPATGSVTDSLAFSLDVYDTDKQFVNFRAGSATIWLDESEVDLDTLTVLRTIDPTDWKSEGADGIIYDPINNALICAPTVGQVLTWRYLDRVSGGTVTLGTICGDVADWCGIEGHDFTGLDQEIYGWSSTQAQASGILEPLIDAYDSDIRPHDFSVQGVKRAGVSGGSLTTERFASNEPRYSVTIRQAAELPKDLTVNFADIDADQQPNNARSPRRGDATAAKGSRTLDMSTMAISADNARNLTDRYFRRMWNERKEVSLKLTAQQLDLEPGDCRTIELDGISDIYRLTRLNISADGVLSADWKYDHPSIAVLGDGTGAAFDGRAPSVVVVPLLSKGFVIDVPLIDDAHNAVNPLIYVAASPYVTGTWPGAVVYQEVGGEYTDEFESVASTSAATWGYTSDVLAAPGSPWLWDRLGEVNVVLQVGSLTGTTEAAIDANPLLNQCIIGDEIVNFTTATLEVDGSYTLSGFKRGRRGTEWACGTHAARDVFLLLDTAQDVEAGLSEVGTDLSFKAVTNGRSESGAFHIDVAFTGASLKPYAPVHLEAVQDGSDWDLAWTRRTRVGGAWTSGTSIPVSETAEKYELEIMDGVTVKRTVTGLTSPTYTYASADQTTDFGAPLGSAPDFRVYQISDAVGRGFVATF